MRRHLCSLSLCLLLCVSCGQQDTATSPVNHTPIGARVNLDQVNLDIRGAEIIEQHDKKHLVKFQCTINNESEAVISFPCLYHSIDELIEVIITDADHKRLTLAKRPLEGLTLAEPQPLTIAMRKTILHYEASIIDSHLKPNDTVEIRVRLHVPSRYDELRSSIEAPKTLLLWP